MASNWTPDVLPQLRIVALLYDQVERGEYRCASELRYWMDGVGVTFMGTQDRRWSPPKVEDRAIRQAPQRGPLQRPQGDRNDRRRASYSVAAAASGRMT